MEQMRNEINELIEQSKQKAKVLTEALPYIRRFNNCYVVVKYGGSAMKDKNLQKSVIRDVALLKLVGMKPIIVHGGGKEINTVLKFWKHSSSNNSVIDKFFCLFKIHLRNQC